MAKKPKLEPQTPNPVPLECPLCLSKNVQLISQIYEPWNSKEPEFIPHVRRLYYCPDCNEYFLTAESIMFWSPIYQDAYDYTHYTFDSPSKKLWETEDEIIIEMLKLKQSK